MDIYDYLPTDFNDIGVASGDKICLCPRKAFFLKSYLYFFRNFGGNIGPFDVVVSVPSKNATEIDFFGERVILSNDLLIKFYWN